jgi:hypothetical protein
VDSNDLGFGHWIGLAAKAGAIRSEGIRLKCYPLAAGDLGSSSAARGLQVKRRGSRQENASIKTWSSVSIRSKRKRL